MKQPDDPDTGGGVLASLPTTRPQRRSPKRTPRSAASTPSAGRPGRSPSAEPKPKPKPSPKPSPKARPKPEARPARPARPAAPAAAQGFEPGTAHGSVEPPSRADVVGSVVHGAGEIVHVGLDVGRLLLRSVLGRRRG